MQLMCFCCSISLFEFCQKIVKYVCSVPRSCWWCPELCEDSNIFSLRTCGMKTSIKSSLLRNRNQNTLLKTIKLICQNSLWRSINWLITAVVSDSLHLVDNSLWRFRFYTRDFFKLWHFITDLTVFSISASNTCFIFFLSVFLYFYLRILKAEPLVAMELLVLYCYRNKASEYVQYE